MRESVLSRLPTARALLLLVFFTTLFGSWAIVSDMAINFHVSLFYGRGDAIAPIFFLTLLILIPFLFVRFSFGYFVGFNLFVMMCGYFWVNRFGTLGYNRSASLVSATASIILFLIPSLLLIIPAKKPYFLSRKVLNLIPDCVLGLSVLILVAAAFEGFFIVSLADMYKHRDEISHSGAINYAIGIYTGALLPFAFACALFQKRWIVLALLCGVALLFYATTFTKISLLIPFYLIFIAALTSFFEARAVVILSLLIPIIAGLIARVFNTEITNAVFGFLLVRQLAVPSISLEHYYVFFADHPLTNFCQIALIKKFVDCPYQELGVALSNWFRLGNQNASLFATEGVASVGPMLAPLVALFCGLVIAAGNAVSAGLPKQFILISACMMPQVLLNVPLSVTFLSHGMGVLFALWYLTPRDYFERDLAPSSLRPADGTVGKGLGTGAFGRVRHCGCTGARRD
jgi:hypothetical protein